MVDCLVFWLHNGGMQFRLHLGPWDKLKPKKVWIFNKLYVHDFWIVSLSLVNLPVSESVNQSDSIIVWFNFSTELLKNINSLCQFCTSMYWHEFFRSTKYMKYSTTWVTRTFWLSTNVKIPNGRVSQLFRQSESRVISWLVWGLVS